MNGSFQRKRRTIDSQDSERKVLSRSEQRTEGRRKLLRWGNKREVLRRRDDEATVMQNEWVVLAKTNRSTTTGGIIDERSRNCRSDTHQVPNIQVRVDTKVSRRDIRNS